MGNITASPVLVIVPVAAKTGGPNMGESPTAISVNEQEIINAEREWADVVMKKDKASADKILADEFRLTGPELERLSTGRAATKDDWMGTLGLLDVRLFDLSDTQVTIYG